MKKNKFLNSLTGANELDINNMEGFRSPDEAVHEEIFKRYTKAIRLDSMLCVFWTLISLAFVIWNLSLYFSTRKSTYLVVTAIFAIVMISSLYRMKKYDVDVMDHIRKREYQIRECRIDRLLSRVISQSGAPAVKIKDENDNVYNHEFALKRKNRNVFKKDPDSVFTVIRVGNEKWMYSLTCLTQNTKQQAV